MRPTFAALLFTAAVVSSHVISPLVQPGYVAPGATGYIYRSDNNGPASLIQLGSALYQQPHAFAPPIPILQQLVEKPVYEEVPALLPYVAAQPIAVEDAEDDDDDNADGEDSGDYIGGEEIDYGHAHEKGAGSDYGEENHAAHGEKGSKGFLSKGHHAKGQSGHYGKEHQEGYASEAKGEKGSHHNEASAGGKQHEAGGSYSGGDHGHKKHHSKGEEVTGYHKVYNKDEFKKDHDSYDVADKSGHFNKFGYQKGQHGTEAAAHETGGNHDSGYEKDAFGKAGSFAKGNHDEKGAGHSADAGHESHYNHQEDFGKKGGSEAAKDYGYEDGDEDYDDDE